MRNADCDEHRNILAELAADACEETEEMTAEEREMLEADMRAADEEAAAMVRAGIWK